MTVLLVMNVPPVLEDDMVDYLLSLECVGGFTSYEVRGHGENRRMSLPEQVSGRQRRIQFETFIEDSDFTGIVGELRARVGPDIVYWEQLLGRIGRV